MSRHCCDQMHGTVEHQCAIHPEPAHCPDFVVMFWPESNSYVLPIRDGENAEATSGIVISFCPWCGHELPERIDVPLDDGYDDD